MTSRYAQVIAHATATGVKAVIQSVIVMAGVVVLQVVACIFVIIFGATDGIEWVEVLFILIAIVASIASILGGAYLCYMTTMNKIVAVAIESAQEMITEIGTQLAVAVQKKTGMKNITEYGSVAAVIDVGTFIKEQYNSMPWLLRMALEFVLGRLPVGNVLMHVMKEGETQHSEMGSAEKKTPVTTLAEEYVLSHDSFAWLFWFIPAVILGQATIVVLQAVL